MGIPLLNVFPTKEIKSYKMCLALLCFPAQCVMDQALLFMPEEKWGWLGRVQCHKIRTPVHTRVWHLHVCAHTSPERMEQQPGCSPSGAEGTSPPLNPLLENSSGWAEPPYVFTGYLLYLLTEYLECFLNLNCTGERNSPLNCDQPEL